MRIHVTKKMAERLKKSGFEMSNSADKNSGSLGEWHANITTVQRRQCILFIHDQTRFSLALIGVTQKDLKELTSRFIDMLANTMLKLNFPVDLVERTLSLTGELSFDTQCCRSVQGTLRIAAADLESFTWDGSSIMDLAPYSLSARLCERPCSIKGMKQTEYLQPAQEMRKLLEQLPDAHISRA